jgi:CheY-like chemotaxis protein
MSKRILVVEDHEDNRQIIRDMLSTTDYEITEAENGEEALAAVAKQRPDLILMEIQLPSMDGHEATRRLRTNCALASTPIIAVPPTRHMEKNRKRGKLAATNLSPPPTVRGSCLRRSTNICPSCDVCYWHLADKSLIAVDVCFRGQSRLRRQGPLFPLLTQGEHQVGSLHGVPRL